MTEVNSCPWWRLVGKNRKIYININVYGNVVVE
jgi:hypothetical protein